MRRKRLKRISGRILAIDPSPKGTGIARIEDGILTGFAVCTEAAGTAKKIARATLLPKVKLADESARMVRLHTVREMVLSHCRTWHPSMIGLEDYTFGSGGRGGGQLQIGELGGVLRLALWEHGYKVRTYHPGSVKLFWTGRGDAEKDDMIERAVAVMEETGSPMLAEFRKMAKVYQEAVSDALAIGSLLREEIRFRQGKWLLNEAPEHIVRVFNRVTDSMPVCLIDRPFMEREER